MTPLTADKIHSLLDPFVGDTLRSAGQIGSRALALKMSPTAISIVDDDGDEVAHVGHQIDADLMAAAPQLARECLGLLNEIADLRSLLLLIVDHVDSASIDDTFWSTITKEQAERFQSIIKAAR